MDAVRQRDKIVIHGADNDPGMRRLVLMQSHEVPAVMGQYGASGRDRGVKHLIIRRRQVFEPRFRRCNDIVSQRPELDDARKREIFVSHEAGYELQRLIFRNCPFDLFAMTVRILQRIFDFARTQSRIRLKDCRSL
jgi:hypothetical protein